MTRIVLLFESIRIGAEEHHFIIGTPAPYSLDTALEHLSRLDPERASRIQIRHYEEVGRERYSLRPEQQDTRETIPAPAPSEEAERLVGYGRGADGG